MQFAAEDGLVFTAAGAIRRVDGRVRSHLPHHRGALRLLSLLVAFVGILEAR